MNLYITAHHVDLLWFVHYDYYGDVAVIADNIVHVVY